jgi:hypothetical protein
MKVKQLIVDELLEDIMSAYETLDGDELADEYNRLFPGQPIGYDGDGIFSRSITGVVDEN